MYIPFPKMTLYLSIEIYGKPFCHFAVDPIEKGSASGKLWITWVSFHCRARQGGPPPGLYNFLVLSTGMLRLIDDAFAAYEFRERLLEEPYVCIKRITQAEYQTYQAFGILKPPPENVLERYREFSAIADSTEMERCYAF